MEDEELNNTSHDTKYLDKIICEKCGLPLKLDSYQIIESNKLIIRFICPNTSHKTINNLNFDEFQKIINCNINNNCKCLFCQKIIVNDKAANYCNDCKKIICFNCKGNHSHKNIIKYENQQKNDVTQNNNNNNSIYQKKLSKRKEDDDFDSRNDCMNNSNSSLKSMTERENKNKSSNCLFENEKNDELKNKNKKFIKNNLGY